MEASFVVDGVARIQLLSVPERVASHLATEFPTYFNREGAAGHDHRLVVRFLPDLTLPPNARVAKTAAYDETSFFLLDSLGPVVRIDAPYSADACEFQVAERIDGELLEEFLEMLVRSEALRQGMVFIHSSAVAVRGQGVVLSAWRRTGKTEVMLEMVRRGHAYVSDDWSILSQEGNLHAFEKPIALYTHDLASAPWVARAYHGGLKGAILARYSRLRSLAAPGNPSRTLRMRVERRILRSAVQRMHLKTNLHVAPERVGIRQVSRSVPLRVVYMLCRTNRADVSFVPQHPELMAERALANYRFETRTILDPDQLRFAFPSQECDLGLGVTDAALRTVLVAALSRPEVHTYEVQIPLDKEASELAIDIEEHVDGILSLHDAHGQPVRTTP